MAGKLPGPTDNDKLKQLSARTYKEQGVWFLNGYWDEMGASEAENVWKYVHKAQELDLQKGKEGNELDEMMGHRFLEVFSETMTVRELRERLTAKTQERPKFISLAHYLIIKYDLDYKVLVNASQGGNEKELREAQAKLDQVQAALKESEAKAAEAAAALREAQRSEAEAKKREAEAKASEAEAKVREAEAKAKEAEAKEREAEARAAQDELEAALAELKAQEDAYNNKKADLERKSEEGGVVSRNKAKAELAQHLAEDPLPLRRAKINQEAAVRKAEKATQIASDARAVASAAADQASAARAQAEKDARDATAARAAAEQAAAESARAAEAAEAALEATRQAFAEAEAYLNEIRSRPGSANGALWWIDRELHEAKAYLPASKGGYAKKKF